MKNLIAFVFVFLLLVAGANAELVVNKYTNDFVLSSANNEQLKLCACETKVDTIIVENTGIFHGSFSVQIMSDYPGAIRPAETDFWLDAKYLKEIPIYLEDSCGIYGTFNYEITVRNSYGRIEKLYRTINVQECQTTLLEVVPENAETGLCYPASYDVTVTNVGTFDETFTLDMGPFADVATVPVKDMYLKPDQSHTQTVNITLPCSDYGEFVVPFAIFTPNQGMTAFEERQLTVENQYGFGIELPTEMEACALTESIVTIGLENVAPVQDDILLELAGPSFISMNWEYMKEISLDAYEDKEVQLNFAPQKADIGEHTLTVTARDKYGGIVKTRDVQVDVSNCYDPSVELRQEEAVALPDIFTGCCGQETFYVNVQNDGDREQVFRLTLDGPSFFVLDETTVRVQPSQNINIPLVATLPCTDEIYEAKVIISPVGMPGVNVSDSVVVESLTQRTCHMVQIDDDELAVREDQDVIPIMVKHTGIAGGDYDIEIASQLFTSMEETINLQPGEHKAIHLVPKTNLSDQSKGRYIVEPLFTLQEENIPYNEHVGVQLKGKTWCQQFKDWFFGLPWASVTFCVWVLTLLAIIFLLLAILLLLVWAGKITLFNGGLSREFILLLKTLLIVLLIVLLLLFLFLRNPSPEMQYERLADNSDPTVLEWYQNTEANVNLAVYFDDPDMDILAYTATQPRDLSVHVEGNVMTLTPDHNFVGENTMVVTASDGKGGVTDSPIFLLRVIPEKELGLLGWLNLWCSYIKVFMLLMIVMVLLLLLLTVKERKPREETKKNVIVVVPGKSTRKASVKRKKVRFFASKTGTKAHMKGCMALGHVKKKNLRIYKSKTAVLNKGLALCSMCYHAPAVNPTARMKHKSVAAPKKAVVKKSSKKAVKKSVKKKAVRKATVRKSSKKTVKKPIRKKTSRKVAKKSVRKVATRKASN
ncbi:hypothetical protein GOV11_00615, partial [Candidatus Woesearchaeota archaeon]|nr:hypothetical protein [Candidatus Woesearchaeota archaeon]